MGSWRFRSFLAATLAVGLLAAASVLADSPVPTSTGPALAVAAPRDLAAYKEESLPGGPLAAAAYLVLLALVGGYAAWTARKVALLQAQVDALAAPCAEPQP